MVEVLKVLPQALPRSICHGRWKVSMWLLPSKVLLDFFSG